MQTKLYEFKNKTFVKKWLKMESSRNEVLNELIECIGVAAELDSDDSEKEDVLIELVELANKATYLPLKKHKKQWVKPWRKPRKEHGSFSFLTNELYLSDDSSYRNYLRMSKLQFETVLNLIEQDIKRSNTVMREAITPAEKLALTLRFLLTGETFKSIEYQSSISKAAISRIIPEVCEAIWKRLRSIYLKFPNNVSDWENIAKEFALKWQFPNCIGALEGKHIHIRSHRKGGVYDKNYKGTNNIILMALVDANCKFVYVNVGCNGPNNDAGVFLQCKLRTILEDASEIPANALVGNGRSLPFVVIGDDTFPLQTHLLKPYPYQTNSSEKQVFNARISRARHVVEHSFGILSNRFRVFLTHINLKVETVQKITFACCVLHNFLIQSDETYLSTSEISNSNVPRNNLKTAYNPSKGEEETIRQQFMAYFNNEGKLD